MPRPDLLAAVDLGSNSFHLQVGRVVDGQIYALDSLREVVRLGAGLTSEKLDVTLIPQTQSGEEFFSAMVFFQAVEDLERRIETWDEFKLGISG